MTHVLDEVCSVLDCSKPVKSRNLCSMHYERQRLHGDTSRSRRKYSHHDPIELFASHVEFSPTGCWNWTASTNEQGYGQFTLNGVKIGAHRAGWILLVGELEPWQQIDHLCRNHHCVSPDHLEPVTCRENLLRGDTHAARNNAKTEYIHGHQFTSDNIIWKRSQNGRPKRVCRECNRQDLARRRASRKASA